MAITNREALDERINNLADAGFNGIDFVEVRLDPPEASTEAHLLVHFLNDEAVSAFTDFRITGGTRIPSGAAAGQVQVTSVTFPDPSLPVLHLTAAPIGDYSTYTLHLEHAQVDPLLSEIDFKFRPGCFNNCPPDWERPPTPKSIPAIDYLAKDYDSFRHTIITWMMKRVPGWLATSEADLDMVLLELFSAAADELSDYQDRVMNEAYLATARKRVSLARHARLLDYHVHQGNQAGTWLALSVAAGQFPVLGDEESPLITERFTAWTGEAASDPASQLFVTRDGPAPLFRLPVAFETDLDGATLSMSLQDAFAGHGHSLAPTATILVETAGSAWRIEDDPPHRLFLILKGPDTLAVYAPHLHALLNRLGLYTWSGSIPAVAAGSTGADLGVTEPGGPALTPAEQEALARTIQNLLRSPSVPRLIIQEHLNPRSGEVRGRDPAKRQLLTLLPGDAAAVAAQDPVTTDWYVRVRWLEPLEHTYCFLIDCAGTAVEDVSLFHGNLVRAYHGRPRVVSFKDPIEPLASPEERHYERRQSRHERKRAEAVCRLPDGPLSYKDTPPSGEAPPRTTLEVQVEVEGTQDPWNEVSSLVHSDNSAERGDHFVVETDELGRSLIRFGNGVNGRKLSDGALVHCQYQIGRGLDGNVGADTLRHFDGAAFAAVTDCWNPFDVTDGRSPEPVGEIVRRVPEAYRARQLRAVTLSDYVDRAREVEGVAAAAAQYRWTGSWRTVRITIDPEGTTELTDELTQQVAGHLEAVRLIGEDLELRPPRFVPLEIDVALCIHSDYWPQDVRFVLEQEFSDGYTSDGRTAFFHPDRWTFGQALRASQILGHVQNVDGVDHVLKVSLKRRSEVTPGTPDEITVRPNEIILVKNNPDSMEEGTIRFDVRGGRR